jgi:hypothetical protein
VALAVRTGIPWDAWADADDEVILTALRLLGV